MRRFLCLLVADLRGTLLFVNETGTYLFPEISLEIVEHPTK